MWFGKTLTALSCEGDNGGKILILAPPNVVKNKVWEEEAKKFGIYNTITTRSLYNTKIVDEDWSQYSMLIVDEVHKIKSPTTKISKRVKFIASKFDKVLGLTGTWAPNGYVDVWGMARSLGIPMFKQQNKNKFLMDYYHCRDLLVETRWGSDMKIPIPVSLKKDTDLFDKINEHAFIYTHEYEDYDFNIVEVDGEKCQVIDELEQSVLEDEALSVLQKHSYLRQVCNGWYYHPDTKEVVDIDTYKIDAFNNLYSSLKSQGHKVIVVYTFKADLQKIVLAEDDIAIQERVGEGLNLQHYDTVIFYNPTFNMGNYEQCRKRILRLGQEQYCQIFMLVRTGLYDEHVYNRLNSKVSDSQLLEEYKNETNK